MNDKRYSVFISSTFDDLKEERQAVQDVVISAGDFPVQMESFPAADEDQFAFIKTLIDKCDYYVLIVGGRYGTPSDDGMSYTEKEYRYAVSKGIPVLGMLHGARGSISADKTEESLDGKRRLEEFVAEVERHRLRKTWTTRDGLKLAVREALDHAKATKPRVGWVRGDAIASVEALVELNEVRRQNEQYRDAIGHLEVGLALPPIPAADDPVEIDLLPLSVGNRSTTARFSGSYAKLRSTWIGAFPIFYTNLKWGRYERGMEAGIYYVDEEESFASIGAGFASAFASFDTRGLYRITDETFHRLSSYYTEVGLMAEESDQPFTEAAHRLARRHRINNSVGGICTIVEGAIENKSPMPSKSKLDDEIPF